MILKFNVAMIGFRVEIDGHYHRFLYRLSLDFRVLECRIGQEKFFALYAKWMKVWMCKIRHGGTLSNWAVRRYWSSRFWK